MFGQLELRQGQRLVDAVLSPQETWRRVLSALLGCRYSCWSFNRFVIGAHGELRNSSASSLLFSPVSYNYPFLGFRGRKHSHFVLDSRAIEDSVLSSGDGGYSVLPSGTHHLCPLQMK